MCLTMPARVVAVSGGWAQVDLGGRVQRASTIAVPEVRPGDWAFITAGALVRVLDPETAAQISAALLVASGDISPDRGGLS